VLPKPPAQPRKGREASKECLIRGVKS